jgi:hypothetical protein
MLEMIRAALLAVIGTQTELRLRPGSDGHDAYLRLSRRRPAPRHWIPRDGTGLSVVSGPVDLLERLPCRASCRSAEPRVSSTACAPGSVEEIFTVKKTGGTHQAGWAWVYDLRDGQITRILATQDLSGVANEVGSALTKAQEAVNDASAAA